MVVASRRSEQTGLQGNARGARKVLLLDARPCLLLFLAKPHLQVRQLQRERLPGTRLRALHRSTQVRLVLGPQGLLHIPPDMGREGLGHRDLGAAVRTMDVGFHALSEGVKGFADPECSRLWHRGTRRECVPAGAEGALLGRALLPSRQVRGGPGLARPDPCAVSSGPDHHGASGAGGSLSQACRISERPGLG
jgi:hypothetical protein